MNKAPLSLLFLLLSFNVFTQNKSFYFDGELSAQTKFNLEKGNNIYLGGRYVPELNYKNNMDSISSISFLASANLSFSKTYISPKSNFSENLIKSYRAWVRYIYKPFEVRVGLQKIDFGSALLLRPLQWFNEIDPRDPQGLTYGVNGVLMRYYFNNNSNLWLWGLYGNSRMRGLDIISSYDKSPEFGGRFQSIIDKGEVSISFHQRITTFDEFKILNPFKKNPENRVGIDAKVDVGFGLWFEGSYIKRAKKIGPFTKQLLLTLGADYTYNIGNGLTMIAEHFYTSYGENKIDNENTNYISAFSFSYPISYFGNINTFFYHQWESSKNTFAINYKHSFNKLTGFLIGTYNPESVQNFQTNEILNTFTGPSIRIMLIYNH